MLIGPLVSDSGDQGSLPSQRTTVLIVDDEPAICWALKRLLSEEEHEVLTASSAEEGLKLASVNPLSLVLLDVRLPKEDGISALPKFIAATRGAPIIIMTAFGDLETAVAAVENGACDYLIKPFHLEDALRTCRNALRRGHGAASRFVSGGKGLPREGKIIGRSAAIQQAFRQIALVASSDLSVLISGETGTGKELVAEAIHRNSRRRQAPYLPIAPVTLNPDLVESELFGHVKGAFTGATDDRLGLFEQAEGGTLLLDEIGDLPLGVQVKLLRVLEQGDYFRVGDTKPRMCDVRILAATNCNLQQHVLDGKFREDLFYRLNGLHIHLPPLRERLEDIPLLCSHFLQCIDYPNADVAVDDSLVADLAKRPWHGNVRELKNAIEHAAINARGRPISIEDFPTDRFSPEPSAGKTKFNLENAIVAFVEETLGHQEIPEGGLLPLLLAAIEPVLFRIVLQRTEGNRLKAAEVLGIHRGTLRERLRHFNLELP